SCSFNPFSMATRNIPMGLPPHSSSAATSTQDTSPANMLQIMTAAIIVVRALWPAVLMFSAKCPPRAGIRRRRRHDVLGHQAGLLALAHFVDRADNLLDRLV